MNPLLTPIFGGLIDIGKELITDKDKQIEYAFKTQEIMLEFSKVLIGTQTTPWVDATVKLLYALQTFWRPLVGAAMTAFGAYCHYKGVSMDAGLHAIFDGAFPAWGASRHIEKVKKIEKKSPPPFDDEDMYTGG